MLRSMKIYGAILFCCMAMAQSVETTTTASIPLSDCDEVHIQMPLDQLTVSQGIVTVYAFPKKYGMRGLILTCAKIVPAPAKERSNMRK